MGKVIEGTYTALDAKLLRIAYQVAQQSMKDGNHPFGAIVADAEGKILTKAGNNHKASPALHAETKSLLDAGEKFSPEELDGCTLYTTVEPCVMCAGAMYWTGVRRLVYAVSEKELLALTGDNAENPTFDLDCRKVFASGQKDITVVGPVDDPELRELILQDHRTFWKNK